MNWLGTSIYGMKIKTDDFEVEFDDSAEVKDAIFNYLIEKYYVKLEAFNGETIMQCDDTLIEAPSVLAKIADSIIKFKVTCFD